MLQAAADGRLGDVIKPTFIKHVVMIKGFALRLLFDGQDLSETLYPHGPKSGHALFERERNRHRTHRREPERPPRAGGR